MSTVPDLRRAYRTAIYTIGPPVAVRIVIGRRNPAADRVLAALDCYRRWAIVTPCNPASVRLSDADNRGRLRRMAGAIARARIRHCAARSQSPEGDWIEPGYCLFDLSEPAALALARRFGQRAIVAGVLDGPATLRWTGL
ncbi:MAG: DUF3293 domain-containing protein [Nevskiales bacterium]|nr:DUF3293 domain-containing protein [Nevskiales bacterium]